MKTIEFGYIKYEIRDGGTPACQYQMKEYKITQGQEQISYNLYLSALHLTARPCSPGDPSFQLSGGQVTQQKASKQGYLSQSDIIIRFLSSVMVRQTILCLVHIISVVVDDDQDKYLRVLVSSIK